MGTDLDSADLDDGVLALELERLIDEEHQLSRRRAQLHKRLEFLQGGGAHDGPTRDQLAAIKGEESHVSKSRQEVHRRIDLLRAERIRRANR